MRVERTERIRMTNDPQSESGGVVSSTALLGDKRYQVWFVPTEKGKQSFGWQEIGGPELMTAEDASFEAYCANLEEPAPDAREYGSYKVREVSPNYRTERSAGTAGRSQPKESNGN